MKRASLFFGVFGVLAVLAAGFALAAAINITSTAQWFQSRVFIGGKTTGTLPTASDQNGIADTRGAYFAWDFPSIGPGGAGQAGGHLDGPTFAKAGVLVGDNCLVTTDRSEWDGGWPLGLVPRCRVPADGYLHLQVDYLVDDAGTVDPVDAGFYFRTIGFTPR